MSIEIKRTGDYDIEPGIGCFAGGSDKPLRCLA
jgi:hypothetical protein